MIWYTIFSACSFLANFSLIVVQLIIGLDDSKYDMIRFLTQREWNSDLVIVILSILAILVVVIGAILAHQLRTMFRLNYFFHGTTIIESIVLQGFGILLMLIVKIITVNSDDWIQHLQNEYKENGGLLYPAIYCSMVILGSMFPICSQIACIKLSIKGNWNELFQADLQDADLTITINSKMFADFR